MTHAKLIGLVSNQSQLVVYKTAKDDEKTVLLLVDEKFEMKFENSVVTQNVTRDFVFCWMNNSLKVRQFEMKFLSFYPLIVANYH
jgi:hypothetical protein